MLDAKKGIIGCGHQYGDGSEKAILVTNDGGQTWVERADESYYLEVALLTSDGQGFATGQFKEMFYSNNWGNTWSIRNVPGLVEFNWLQYMGGDTLYGFGYQGLPPQYTPAFIKTFDAGLSWQISLMPDFPVQNDAYFFNTQEGWAVGNTGFLLHTVDAGQSWQPYSFGESLKAKNIDFATDKVGWAVGDKGLVLHTTNGGMDWNRENCGYLGTMGGLSAPTPTTAFANGEALQILSYQPGIAPTCEMSAVKPDPMPHLERFPNPALDFVELKMTAPNLLKKSDKVLVLNALGQIVTQKTGFSELLKLDLTSWPKGIYTVVVIRGNSHWVTGRFIKI